MFTICALRKPFLLVLLVSLSIPSPNAWPSRVVRRHKFAFATVAMGDTPVVAEPYLLSAVVMGRALLELQSQYPLAVLVSAWDAKSQRVLAESCPNCVAHVVSPIHKKSLHIASMHWACAWNKLHLWELPYSKVVFLDADVVIMQNIDSLFDYPSVTMARNRCGLCCTHALGTAETYSSGMMVLQPNLHDRGRLQYAIADAWESDQHAIQGLFPVAAVLPDIDNVFAVTTLASCGCRPGQKDSSYVSELLAVPPLQNKVLFDAEREYFSGIYDDDVRTIHLFNPKPWFARKVGDHWDVPCGGKFIDRWHELLQRAMNFSTASVGEEERDTGFQVIVNRDNSSANKMAEILHNCPPGPLRQRLRKAARLFWSPHGLGLASARSLRMILKPLMYQFSVGAQCPASMSEELDQCLSSFVKHVQYWGERQIDRKEIMAWVSHTIAMVAAALPSCHAGKSENQCLLLQLMNVLKALLQSGYEQVAEDYFWVWQKEKAIVWKHVWQFPQLYAPTLRAFPVWNVSHDFHSNELIPRLVAALRRHWYALLSEYRFVRNTEPTILHLAYPDLNLDTGNWTKLMLYDGEMVHWGRHAKDFQIDGEPYPARELHPRLCDRMPFTCNLVRPFIPGIMDPTLPYVQSDQEQVNFFSLTPGSRILEHSAFQNGRLTVHTCLSGCSRSSFLQVGPHKLHWERGEPIIFDDSFLHHVQIDPALSEPRVIFHVMVMHPDIDTKAKYEHHNPKFVRAF